MEIIFEAFKNPMIFQKLKFHKAFSTKFSSSAYENKSFAICREEKFHT